RPYTYQQSMQPKKPKQPRDLENLLVRVWLPRVFIIVLLLGVLWAFLAAVNAGIITESVRCWLGVLGAVVMYVLGVRQINRDRAGLGKVLLGGSHSILILSISAAHLLFDLIPAAAAISLYLASLAVIIGTALRWRSQTL